MQLEAVSSHPIASYLGEETNPRLTTTSFQGAVESSKVSPQPPLLQTKQPQFPQPLLIRLVLSPASLPCSGQNQSLSVFKACLRKGVLKSSSPRTLLVLLDAVGKRSQKWRQGGNRLLRETRV